MATVLEQKREKRSLLIKEGTDILANTTLNAEQRAAADAKFVEARAVASDIVLLEEAERSAAEERQREQDAEQRQRAGRPPLPQPGSGETGSEEQREADKATAEKRNREHRQKMTRYLQTGDDSELRAMGTAPANAGGYFVPVDMADTIESAILSFGGILPALGSLNTASGETINYPTSNDTANQAVIIGENPANDVDEQDITVGSIPSNVSTLTTKEVIVSNQVLQDSKFDMDAFIRDNMIERANRGLCYYAVNGSQDGNFASLKSVAVGATSTSPTDLGLTDLTALFGSVDAYYAAQGRWGMNRNTQLYLGGLRNQLGAPIFQLNGDGLLTRILGQDITTETNLPNMGAGATPIIFGNLKKYLLRRVSGFSIMRLTERHALRNQTGFVMFFRAGSIYLNAGTNPIQSLKMHA